MSAPAPAGDPKSLILVPWHIGNRLDVTVNAARAARRLRVFLAEEPEHTRAQFASDLGIDCRGKEFLPIPERPDPDYLRGLRERLKTEDLGLICSGGIPCFIDPGGWVVAALREAGTPVSALAGPSILSTMLSLSGIEWPREHARGSFVVYLSADAGGRGRENFLETFRRADEPVFVFLGVAQFRECLAAMEPVLGGRAVSAFFDLTKLPRSKFPYADRVTTLTCREWRREAERVRWREVSDVALMVHSRESAR